MSARMLLCVCGRRYMAGAVWEQTRDGWRCVRAAPILAWLVGCSARTARARLERERVTYEWINL